MMEPMYAGGDGIGLGVVLIVIAIIGAVAGFAWIRRVTTDPEDGPSSWRSHR